MIGPMENMRACQFIHNFGMFKKRIWRSKGRLLIMVMMPMLASVFVFMAQLFPFCFVHTARRCNNILMMVNGKNFTCRRCGKYRKFPINSRPCTLATKMRQRRFTCKKVFLLTSSIACRLPLDKH